MSHYLTEGNESNIRNVFFLWYPTKYLFMKKNVIVVNCLLGQNILLGTIGKYQYSFNNVTMYMYNNA